MSAWAVCAHDNNALEKAIFSNVEIKPAAPSAESLKLESTLETVAIASKDRRVVYHASASHFEAPNWSRDGKDLYLQSGRSDLPKLPVTGGEPQPIDTGFAIRCNNDHGISPDGKQLAISDQIAGAAVAHIYVAADRRRHAAAGHAAGAILLARLVAGRQDAGLLRRAERRITMSTRFRSRAARRSG